MNATETFRALVATRIADHVNLSDWVTSHGLVDVPTPTSTASVPVPSAFNRAVFEVWAGDEATFDRLVGLLTEDHTVTVQHFDTETARTVRRNFGSVALDVFVLRSRPERRP